MKKVLNINLASRVIPIEDTAFEMLKQYIDSLKHFFAREEGKEEIISDIENRIAEIFHDKVKKGVAAITDEDVAAMMASMGRPEDFAGEEEPTETASSNFNEKYASAPASSGTSEKRRLFRNSTDKVLGGVCSGIAHYLNIDPAIVRILFAIVTFGGWGFGFVLYLFLWMILPVSSLESKLGKRLYRNPDDKVIGGVAGGLAAYFDKESWIIRLIFAAPILLSAFFNAIGDGGNPFSFLVGGSLIGTFAFTYIVLWIVLPVANTTTEKMEMRGEKVDLESIKATFREGAGTIKATAGTIGEELKEKAQSFGQEFSTTVAEKSKQFNQEMKASNAGSGIAHAIGVLFKAFFLFIFGTIAFALFVALLGVLISGAALFPLKNFVIEGFWQNAYAWGTLILFLGVPIIGMVVWGIRRITNTRSKNNYLGWVFGGLWTLGWVSMVLLISSLASSFKSVGRAEEIYTTTQPSTDKLLVKVAPPPARYYGSWDYGVNLGGAILFSKDSVMVRNVRVKISQSSDSAYHVIANYFSRGNNGEISQRNAESIGYEVKMDGNTLLIDQGITLPRSTKFRNQQVQLVIQVPVGKKIEIDRSVSRKLHFIDLDLEGDDDWDWDYDSNSFYHYDDNVEYIMTVDGLKSTEEPKTKSKSTRKGYRYNQNEATEETDVDISIDSIDTKDMQKLEQEMQDLEQKTKEKMEEIQRKAEEKRKAIEQKLEEKQKKATVQSDAAPMALVNEPSGQLFADLLQLQ